jgi:hypothetical protein
VPHGTFKNHASGSGHRGVYNKNIIIFKKNLRNKSLKEDEEKYCANTS